MNIYVFWFSNLTITMPEILLTVTSLCFSWLGDQWGKHDQSALTEGAILSKVAFFKYKSAWKGLSGDMDDRSICYLTLFTNCTSYNGELLNMIVKKHWNQFIIFSLNIRVSVGITNSMEQCPCETLPDTQLVKKFYIFMGLKGSLKLSQELPPQSIFWAKWILSTSLFLWNPF